MTLGHHGSIASSLRSESPPNTMSPIQQLDNYQLENKNPRYSTIGRPGRGLNHILHLNENIPTSTASPVRSVMIVAPGDPIPPNLGPQQQLQLQQMSSDHHTIRPPSEALQAPESPQDYSQGEEPPLHQSYSFTSL